MSSFKYYRNKKNLSQKEVGDYLGITGQAYSNYETGKRQADYETLLKLAELFETSIEKMLMDNPEGDILDELDVAFLGDYGELTEENKATLRDMARLMLKNQGGGKE